MKRNVFKVTGRDDESERLGIEHLFEWANAFKVADNRIHIIPCGKLFAVKRPRRKRAYRVVDSKEKAIMIAYRMKGLFDIIVHDKNGMPYEIIKKVRLR